jgi:two-component system chemotaxis response regulator CheY
MLKVVIVDASAIARDLLGTVLTGCGHEVAGMSHSSSQGYALLRKFQANMIFIALDQMDDGFGLVEKIRAELPKTLVFLVSGEIDGPTLQAAQARGVQGFIVKPFKADAVLKTIRNTVLAVIKSQRQA